MASDASWPLPRRDGCNQARADASGRLATAPVERWSAATGADVIDARAVPHGDGSALLVHAGSTLQLLEWNGRPVWQQLTLGVSSVLHAGRFGRPDHWHALVSAGDRTVALVGLRDGAVVWTWQTEEAASVPDRGASKVFGRPGQLRWVCFPRYSTRGRLVDFADPDDPVVTWDVDYGDTYDVGFGPNVVVADVEGRGEAQIVISSRRGGVYADGEATESIVLGRTDGHLYQAVIDAATGAVRSAVRYRPDPGDYPCARPYGLLQAAPWDASGRRGVVLVSCQVEEYIAVTGHGDDGLYRAWGKFVERDWPEDHRELRPQVTSVADVTGTGTPSLVVGLWDGETWRTVVFDLHRGDAVAPIAELAGRYFWGCHDVDGDGRAEIVVSAEDARQPAPTSRLEAIDGRTLAVVASLPDAALVTDGDSELPEDVNFLAMRRTPVAVPDGGSDGLLVRFDDGLHVWSAAGTRRIAGPEYERAFWRGGGLVLATAGGRVVRCDDRLLPVGEPVAVHGRFAQPLVWVRGDGPEVVTDHAGGRVVGSRVVGVRPGSDGDRAPQDAWTVSGELPALHRDADGVCRLSVSTPGGPAPTVVVHVEPGRPDGATTAITVPGRPADLVPYGARFRLVVNLHTGVHTSALAVYDSGGAMLWSDPKQGGHPSRPGVLPVVGDDSWLIAADDHGRLRVHDDAGGTVGDHDWTAAYTTPIAVPGRDGAGAWLLRADGIHGVELATVTGETVWRTNAALWRHFPGRGALARRDDGGWLLGAVARDGTFDAIDVDTGEVAWTFDTGPALWQRAVAAGDVDGDGCDEFLVGTLDGRLLCLGTSARAGEMRWECRLGASVTNPVLADVDGDGLVEVLVATADGRIRLLA